MDGSNIFGLNNSMERLAILSGKKNCRRSWFEGKTSKVCVFLYDQFEMPIRIPIRIVSTAARAQREGSRLEI